MHESCEVDIDLLFDLNNAHDWDDDHPSPWEEDGLFIADADRCGFDSPQSLQAWFEGFMDRLGDAGFNVVRYRIPEHRVQFGNKQVVFEPRSASPVKAWSPAAFAA